MSRLERISHVVLILTCLLLSGGWVYDRLAQRGSAQNESIAKIPNEHKLVGETVSLPGSSHFVKRTVLLFVRPGCAACTSSMGFYHSLMTMAPRHFRLIVIGDELQATRSYLEMHGVQPDEILAAASDKFGVFATPTILLTGETGKVRAEWIGTLEGPRREEFLRSVQ